MEKPEFLHYLRYLEYWRRPEYAKYLVYPNCLHMLTLLHEPRFRQEISRLDVAEMVMADFHRRWVEGSAPVTIETSELQLDLPATNTQGAAQPGEGSSDQQQQHQQVVG